MITNNRSADWTANVIGFLSRNLLGNHAEGGWQHNFMTAYQIGCEALVALGQADETVVGAIPRRDARLPDELPRWDDLCVSVLMLAAQNSLISYRMPDRDVPLSESGRNINPTKSIPLPNIAAAEGLGPAHATPEVLSVLQALGLMAEGHWSKAADSALARATKGMAHGWSGVRPSFHSCSRASYRHVTGRYRRQNGRFLARPSSVPLSATGFVLP